MRTYRIAAWCCIIAMAANTSSVFGQNLFKKLMQNHYKVKSVSCNSCHVSGKPKTMRSDFGKLFDTELKGKDISKRLEDAKNNPEQKAAVEKVVATEFMDALKKIDKKEYPGSGTYGDAIQAGKINGIKVE